MKNTNTLEEQRVLRIIEADALKKRKQSGNELCAIPHIQYMRDFNRVEWSPAVMGLPEVGRGFESTLLAAPAFSKEWLNRVECLKQIAWDVPLLARSVSEVWNRTVRLPSQLDVGERYVSDGGFLNCWHEEDRTHLLWGTVDKESAASILAFVWLQNVLAGGRSWRRREIREVPESFVEALPIGYLSFGKGKQNVFARTMGASLPILELENGRLLNTRDWLTPARSACMIAPVESRQLAGIYIPEACRSEGLGLIDDEVDSGWNWRLKKTPSKMIAVYPSAFGGQIDLFQKQWQTWLRKNTHMSFQRETEVLLCAREAVLNADKHGCAGALGKRVMLVFIHDCLRRVLKVRVSDPGRGHAHNINSRTAREDQKLGRHLGLMLIHGLASSVRFADEGATIEFDFAY